MYEKRPELSITEYADYLSRSRYGVKKKCDMELFLALPMQSSDARGNIMLNTIWGIWTAAIGAA